MTAGTLTSRGLGFLRSILLVAAIGGTSAGVGGQAFDVANSLPTNLFTLIAGGVLGSVLVPQIVRALRLPDKGREYLDQIFTLTLVVGAALTLVAVLCAPLLVQLYVADWPPSWLRLGTAMAYLCLPQIFFLIAFTVFGQVLNATSRFGAYMWAPVLSNLVAIGGIAAFMVLFPAGGTAAANEWTPQMTALIAGAATLGTLAQALLLGCVVWRSGIRFKWSWSFRGLGQTGRVASWTFFGVLTGQVAFIFTSSAASGAGAALNRLGIDGASLNSLSNAYLIVLLPHALVTVSVVTALFTRMSASAADGRHHESAATIASGARIVTLSGIIATVFLAFFGPLLGEALWNSAVIGQITAVLGLMIVPFSAMYLTQRASLSYGNAVMPFVQAAIVALVTAAGSVLSSALLPPIQVVPAIAGSIAVAHWIAAIFGWLSIRRHLRGLNAWHHVTRTTLGRVGIQLALATTGAAAAYLVEMLLPEISSSRLDSIVRTGAAAAVLLIVYLSGALATRDPSLARLIPPRWRSR